MVWEADTDVASPSKHNVKACVEGFHSERSVRTEDVHPLVDQPTDLRVDTTGFTELKVHSWLWQSTVYMYLDKD